MADAWRPDGEYFRNPDGDSTATSMFNIDVVIVFTSYIARWHRPLYEDKVQEHF